MDHQVLLVDGHWFQYEIVLVEAHMAAEAGRASSQTNGSFLQPSQQLRQQGEVLTMEDLA